MSLSPQYGDMAKNEYHSSEAALVTWYGDGALSGANATPDNCNSWCIMYSTVVLFPDPDAASQAFLIHTPSGMMFQNMPPPSAPSSTLCSAYMLGGSGTSISTDNLGDQAVGVKCKDGIIYVWRSNNVLLYLLVAGAPDKVIEGEVKALADKMQSRTR